MDDTTTIANQQRQIEAYKEATERALKMLESAHIRMVGIGGPLNDDRLKCSPDQRLEFYRLNEDVEGAIGWLRPEDIS